MSVIELPKVTIIMPTYNRYEMLKISLNSILNQTYKNFEIIIIDDCSIDETQKYIEYLQTIDSRIIYIRNQEHMHYNYGLRIGCNMAKGEYIARMDDDDIAYPERLEKQVKFLEKNQDITLVGTFIEIFGNENATSWVMETDPDILNVAINFYNPICHPSVMMRTSFLRKNNINYSGKELYAEDYHLWKEIILKGGKIANIPEILLSYRIHKKSVTQDFQTNKVQEETATRVRKDLLKRFFSEKKVQNIIDNIVTYPFMHNNKKFLFDVLEDMKEYHEILSSDSINRFQNKICGKPCQMEIFFAANDAFSQHLCVAIASILINALPYERHNFYILDGGISEINKNKIEKLKSIKNFNIEYINIDKKNFDNCSLTKECKHISIETYYRYIIPIVKPNLEKAFYFDCDIVVTDTLNEFWNTDLGDNYIAAVEDLWQDMHEYCKNIGIQHSFNAGIMLLNLKKWKKDDITLKLLTKTQEFAELNVLHWQDQEVLNYVFNNNIKFVLPKWNLQQTAYFAGQHSCYTDEEMNICRNRPVIIHYSGNIKPWQKGCRHPLYKEYYKFIKLTPYKNEYYKFMRIESIKKLFRIVFNITNKEYSSVNIRRIRVFGIQIIKIKKDGFITDIYLFGLKIKRKICYKDMLYYLMSQQAQIMDAIVRHR